MTMGNSDDEKGEICLTENTPDVVLELLKEAKAAKVPAQHVLFDSWFCSPASLHQIPAIGYDVIARVKKSEKLRFLFQGRMQNAKTIYRNQKKRRERSAYLLSVEVEAIKDGKHLPVRLVFVRNTSIVFARYMMLALEQRRQIDKRSIGELFFLTIDELEDLRYLDGLSLLLELLMKCAKEANILDEKQINQLLNLFLAKLPDLWEKCLKRCA